MSPCTLHNDTQNKDCIKRYNSLLVSIHLIIMFAMAHALCNGTCTSTQWCTTVELCKLSTRCSFWRALVDAWRIWSQQLLIWLFSKYPSRGDGSGMGLNWTRSSSGRGSSPAALQDHSRFILAFHRFSTTLVSRSLEVFIKPYNAKKFVCQAMSSLPSSIHDRYSVAGDLPSWLQGERRDSEVWS